MTIRAVTTQIIKNPYLKDFYTLNASGFLSLFMKTSKLYIFSDLFRTARCSVS